MQGSAGIVTRYLIGHALSKQKNPDLAKLPKDRVSK
jgi:hypothetical protein